jgi:hypothetical protein
MELKLISKEIDNMTSVEIFLKDGNRITENVETFDINELANEFNSNSVLIVSIGDSLFNKNVVKLVAPATPTTTPNYKILFHDGKEIATYVEDFSSLDGTLNNLKSVMSVIGDVMVDKREIKLITPIQ